MLTTIEALERAAGAAPRATALIAGGQATSYVELLGRTVECAGAIRSAGVRTVALIGDNSVDWIVTDLAARLAGVVLVPIPAFFSLGQIRHAIRDCGADAVLLDRGSAPLAAALPLERLGVLTRRLEWFRPDLEPHAGGLPPATAKISYTSGTTGEPKGVCLTHEAMDRVADSLVEATRELNLGRHLCALPLALLLENVAGVYAPLRNGGTICVAGLESIGWTGAARIDADRLLRRVDELQPDSLILVPQLLHAIVDRLERQAVAPTSLKFVAVGGGHVSPALLDRARALGLPVFQGYGLTEAASVVALSSPKQRRRGSVGRPLAHSEVRIDTNGEVLVSGASFAGYVGRPRPPGAEIATGDLGHIDDDGYLHILGRIKNVYITSFGRNVAPEWIEAELVKQRSIAQAAVFGEARPWSAAVIVPAPEATAEDIDADIAAANAALPDYAQIGDWIPATEPFTPGNGLLTGNGRNRREAIWETYRERINARYDDYLSLRA